jgi:DNA-directed RNA polymerase subunit RPC12/RpoP
MLCVKCGKPLGTFITTAYGENRCEDCYDDYLMTDKGKVEYLIGLVNGELDIEDYDADFLGYVGVCWNKYRDELDFTLLKLYEIEDKAKQLGLLV